MDEKPSSQRQKDPRISNGARRTCLLVLGMHRSGTSAFSGLLASLGAQRPKREMAPQADNPLGFFEPHEIVAIHDRLLAGLGSNWHDWRPLPHGWTKGKLFLDALNDLETAIAVDFDGVGTFLVKDPRICRCAPLWTSLAARADLELVTLHIFRNPVEVAASLRLRNDLDEAESFLLWLRHILEAEVATRNLPRAFISFEGLVADGLQELEGAFRFVDLKIDADADARAAAYTFVDPAMKHQNVNHRIAPTALAAWVERANALMGRLRRTPNDRATLKALDKLRAEFDAGCEAFAPVLASAHRKADVLEQGMQRLKLAEEQRDVLVQSMRTLTWAADRLPMLDAALASANAQVAAHAEAASRCEDLQRQLDEECRKNALLQQAAENAAGMAHDLATARSELEAMRLASAKTSIVIEQVVAERDRMSAGAVELATAWETKLTAVQKDLAIAAEAAQKVPHLEAELTTARAESMSAARDAARVVSMEAALHAERRQHRDAHVMADRLPAVEAEGERLREQLARAALVADRVPDLERMLMEAEARTASLAAQLRSRRMLMRRLIFPQT